MFVEQFNTDMNYYLFPKSPELDLQFPMGHYSGESPEYLSFSKLLTGTALLNFQRSRELRDLVGASNVFLSSKNLTGDPMVIGQIGSFFFDRIEIIPDNFYIDDTIEGLGYLCRPKNTPENIELIQQMQNVPSLSLFELLTFLQANNPSLSQAESGIEFKISHVGIVLACKQWLNHPCLVLIPKSAFHTADTLPALRLLSL